MRVDDLLKLGYQKLKSREIETYNLDAQILLAHALSVSRESLLTHVDIEIDEREEKLYFGFLEQRYELCPIAYITNTVEFFSMDFYVDKNVLIPRGDTEILVEAIISTVGDKNCKLLEIGVGSGAVSISVAKHCLNAEVTAVDISCEAIDIAKKNALAYGLDINFVQSDVFDELGSYMADFIVSNPPYISSDDMVVLPDTVREYEPHIALYGGMDGLCYYRRIINESSSYLKNGGGIFFEIGWDQGKVVRNLLIESGFTDIEIIKDIAGLDRVIKANI